MKIAICAICKNENLYLREWVEHHKNLGFDKIILYDNNAVDGEFPQQVIFDYIDNGYVDVHNVRGIMSKEKFSSHTQTKIYNKCIEEYKDKYEWIAFIDIDEFFEIESGNIHHTFNLMEYDTSEYDTIMISWMSMGDTQMYYNEDSVKDRFDEVMPNNADPNNGMPRGLSSLYVKSILRTSSGKRFSLTPHCPELAKPCSNELVPIDLNQYRAVEAIPSPIWKVMYLKHYCVKSFSEYLCRRLSRRMDKYKLIEGGQLDRFSEYKQVLGWSDQHQKMYDYMINYIDHTENIEKPINKPKEGISIIISAYNAQEFIEECLDSIQNQTYFNDFNDYEILLGIDGCQTTLDKVQQIRHKYKNLRVFMMDDNVGVYTVFNTLIGLASYNWLNFFGADDIMLPNMIETIMSQIGNEPIVRYKFQNFSKDNSNNEIKLSQGAIQIHKIIFNNFGGYQPWRCSADTELLYRLEDIVKIKCVNEVLFKRRIHKNNLTIAKETNFQSKRRQEAFEYINTKSKSNPKIETITTNCKEI